MKYRGVEADSCECTGCAMVTNIDECVKNKCSELSDEGKQIFYIFIEESEVAE